MGFGDSVRNNAQKMLQNLNRACYSKFFQLATKVVYNTPSPSNPGPFADGLLVNQWYPSVGNSFSTQLSTATSRNGSDSLSRISALANNTEFLYKDGTMTLANNVSYAYRAEAIGWPQSEGWSGRIGPYRMVQKSIIQVVAEDR